MFLLPGAERERRALLLGAALAAGAGLSWWPPAGLDAWLARLGGPVSGWLAQGAGILSGLVQPHAPAAPPEAAPAPLAELEREAAAPPAVAGLAWLEVPVLRALPGSAELLLAAGSRHGLAPGMPVVWGRHFLGRIAAVSERECRVRRFSAADERTGVRLVAEEGEAKADIAIGRGPGLPPMLNWPAEGPEPAAGQAVLFRGRGSDPPALSDAGFLLGHLARRGAAGRGDQAWVIEESRPEAADGRVFVAAGALPAEPIQMPAPARTASRALLLQDAVLGGRLSAWESPPGFAPGVLLRAERVLGPVAAFRRGFVWVRADRPEDWAARAVVVLENPVRLVRPADLPPGAAGSWFTRGGDGIPRGLWLGRSGAAPPRAGAPVLLRAPAASGDPP